MSDDRAANAMLTVEEQIAECPTPQYHKTHHYCPSCPWTSDAAKRRSTLKKTEAEFLAASIAVWREVDQVTAGEEDYPGIEDSTDLRVRERRAWEAYRDAMDVWSTT